MRRHTIRAFALLALLAAPAAASSMLHCAEWPHWEEAYDNIQNYDHRGGEAIEWLQLAGCPPVWAADSERWLPNGSPSLPTTKLNQFRISGLRRQKCPSGTTNAYEPGKLVGQTSVLRTPPGCGSTPSAS